MSDFTSTRIKDLTTSLPLDDGRFFVVDSQTGGTRKVSYSSLKSQLADAFDGAEYPYVDAASDGATDALEAITTALANSNYLRFRSGTYLLSDNLTIAAGKVIALEPGAVFKPANGKKLTINGELVAPRVTIGDWSAGGKIVFGSLGNTKEILAEWYGAVGDNSTDNLTAFGRLFDSSYASTENTQPISFGIGYYNVASGVTLRTKAHLKGVPGRKTRIQFAAPSASGALFTIPDASDNVLIENIQFNCFGAGAGVRTSAIVQANSAHTLSTVAFRDCAFSGFNQYGVNLGSGVYAEFDSTEFSSVSNITSQGGTGDTSATCINFAGYGNAVVIKGMCRAGDCEQFLKTPSSASLSIENSTFEQASTALDAITNRGHFIDVAGASIRIENNYFEGIRTDTAKAIINIASTSGYKVSGNYFSGKRAGGSSTVCYIYVSAGASVNGGEVSSNTFNGLPSSFFINVNGSSSACWAPGNVYINDSSVVLTSYANIKAKMSPSVTDFTTRDSINFARALACRAITGVAGVQFPQTLTKDSNGSAGAAGDGVGQKLTLFSTAPTERTAMDYRAEWTSATDGAETADYVLRLLAGGNFLEAFRLIGLGGIKMPYATSAPGAPAAGFGEFYFDTSGGKGRFCVRFPSGAVQVVAVEP